RPDSGQVEVLGLDPQQAGAELRQRIGVQLQEADLPEKAKVWEIMDTFASFYKRTVPWEPLLAEWGLSSKQNAYFGSLSGGQKQRVFIALALINDPELVFLDELTTGLDPQARRQTWELVRAVRDRGKTVVQVTHFMDEAEALCDRVAIINGGRVIALDTPKELIRQHRGGNTVRFTNGIGLNPDLLKAIPGVSQVNYDGGEIVVHGEGPLLAQVATKLSEHNVAPADLRVEQNTLEDVFLSLTS
ncbi:MAG: ABC transporter ATP-binding protein, partial [Anaerolineales bacterium]|nr:ABC transporter ATP-binding protein [Anaerolineales bacterium]